MGKPQKHGEVLIAIAYGKEVEWFCDCAKEFTIMGKSDQINPISRPDLEWRIKPEPKPDVVRYMQASMKFIFGNSNSESTTNKNTTNNTDFQSPLDNLKLTFDGETGKLKSAEVL